MASRDTVPHNTSLALRTAAALTMVAAISSNAATVRFPSSAKEAPSPNGQFTVLNADRDEEPNHILSLQNKKQKTIRALFSYGRHVDVAWSSDSRFFFVNEYSGSDSADCVVVSSDGLKQTKMSVALEKESADSQKTERAAHLYMTCTAWHTNDRVVVSIRGYGDIPNKNMERKLIWRAESQGTAKAISVGRPSNVRLQEALN